METPLFGVTCRTQVGRATQILTIPGLYKTAEAAIEAAVKAWGEHSRSKIQLFTNQKEEKYVEQKQ